MKELKWFLRVVLILALSFYFSCNYTIGQELSKSDLEGLSLKKFKAGDYYAATRGYEKLIKIYPKEESFNYYLGRCYLHLNRVTEWSVKLLQYAASQSFNNDVHYYLAWSYYKIYEFDNAEISINNFIHLARKKEIKQLSPQNLKTAIKIARKETQMAPKIYVEHSEQIILPQIGQIYDPLIDGIFIPKDDAFVSSADKKQDYSGFMYIPAKTQNGSRFYYPGINKKAKLGTDIFSSTRLTGLNFTLPTNLKGINTDYNEDFPYFDSSSNTLYFSSDRPGGLGGFDIYKSVFNPETNTFEEPKRLEFPINSPGDDFLFVPDSGGGHAIFISNRVNKLGEYMAYQINLARPVAYNFPKSTEEIIQLANLPIYTGADVQNVVMEKPQPMGEDNLKAFHDDKLTKALDYQLRCDSLQNVILNCKAELKHETDQSKRKALFSTIAKAKKGIEKYQSEADNLFGESEILAGINQQETDDKALLQADNIFQKTGEYMQVEKNMGGIKLLSYKTQVTTKDTSRQQAGKFPSEKKGPTSSFSILSSSPYSEDNPIPKDFQVPEGLIYRIQLGAFNQNLPVDAFGGLTPLMAEENTSGKITKYYVGIFKTSKEARDALEQVKSIGHKDAFIVSYYNQKKISIQTARELEFGKKK